MAIEKQANPAEKLIYKGRRGFIKAMLYGGVAMILGCGPKDIPEPIDT